MSAELVLGIFRAVAQPLADGINFVLALDLDLKTDTCGMAKLSKDDLWNALSAPSVRHCLNCKYTEMLGCDPHFDKHCGVCTEYMQFGDNWDENDFKGWEWNGYTK